MLGKKKQQKNGRICDSLSFCLFQVISALSRISHHSIAQIKGIRYVSLLKLIHLLSEQLKHS